jgi:hypothetical protein
MFKDCLSVKDLAQKLEIYLINGSAHIVEDMNKYHIILPGSAMISIRTTSLKISTMS